MYNTQIQGTGLTAASNSNCANASGDTIFALNKNNGAQYEFDVSGVCPGESGNGVVLNTYDENWVEGGVQSTMTKACVYASVATLTTNLDCNNDLITGGIGTWVTNNAIATDIAAIPLINNQVDAGSTLQSHGSTFIGATSGVYAVLTLGNHYSDGDHIVCSVSGAGCVGIGSSNPTTGVMHAHDTSWKTVSTTSAMVIQNGGTFVDEGGNTISGGGGSTIVGCATSASGNSCSISGLQILSAGCQGTATSSTTLGLYPYGELSTPNCTGTATTLGKVMTRTGTAQGLNVFNTHAGVSASSGVVTVLKNGSATTVTCTIGTSTSGCRDYTHTFSYAVGDVISFQFTTQGSEVLAGVSATLFAWWSVPASGARKRRMKQLSSIAILLLLCCPIGGAGPVHFVKTHKTLLAADALLILAQAADARSTVYSQRVCPSCIDQGWLGPHPSPVQAWFGTEIEAAGLISLDHLAWHYAPTRGGRLFGTVFITAPLTINAVVDAKDNYAARPIK
jgi:hypothetical protein